MPTSPFQGTLFEEDFLLRTLGSIANSPDVALTELVANAWDAGASQISLTIPPQANAELVVEDDGCGMTAEQFRDRWMTLGYNRMRHQGADAEFPPERAGFRRKAYGRNGVGRHGLLCFADTYEVTTHRDGQGATFVVATDKGHDPFVIRSEHLFESAHHGTRLKVFVRRHLPNADRIRDVLSARFLHDPGFTVTVNERSVPLADHIGLLDKTTLILGDGLSAEAYFIDSTMSGRTTRQQGIAFWVGGRLVGSPSWTVGGKAVVDGRTTFAKRYTVVIKTDHFFDEVNADWMSFQSTPRVERLFVEVTQYVDGIFKRLSHERVEDTKATVFREHRADLERLQPLARLDVAEFVERMVDAAYTIPQEVLSVAVQAVINLERSKSGATLLEKLSKLSEEDVEALDRLLSAWSIRDALTVLDEIDRRLAVVEALAKLSEDRRIDELKTLHPLVTQARWLFGPEYESAEYSSNLSLRKAVEKVFHQRLATHAFDNYRRRPDLLLLADATLAAVAVEDFDSTTGLTRMRDVLLLELKRGGSEIDRAEMNQASDYVEELLGCGLMDGQPHIRAFVVGHACKNVQSVRRVGENPELGQIRAVTYSQLVRTAEKRLFRLKEKLKERYEHTTGAELLERVLGEPMQLSLTGPGENA